jgi:HK97 family phage portal protein
MLDEFRRRIASAISSPPEVKIDKKSEVKVDANRSAPLQVMSGQSPNIPVYSDMSIRKATREGYKISVFVYRAVRTIVQAASGIPWIAIDTDGTPLLDHPFTTAWAKPNKEFSGQDNMEFLIAHLLLCGNALVQPLIVSGKPKEFWMVMPDLVSPIPSDAPGEWLKGWQVVTSKGEQKILPPTQFIHFQQVDPGNPYWGIGPLMAAARTVDTDNEAQDTQKISMQNRGVTDGVFTHEAVLTAEQFEEARRQIREKFLDKSRRREPWVLGAGAKWNQMSLTPIEMDFIASRLANLRAIAAAFGLDPWWLGDRSSSTYNNVMEARKALYEDVVVPILDDIKSTLNLKVAPLYGDIEIGYDLSGVAAMREDFGKKVTQAQALWTMGIPFDQINERLEMGFEEFEGWDSGYLPATLIPTGSSGSSELPAASEGGAGKARYTGLEGMMIHHIKGEGQPDDAPRDEGGRWIGEGGGGSSIGAIDLELPGVPVNESGLDLQGDAVVSGKLLKDNKRWRAELSTDEMAAVKGWERGSKCKDIREAQVSGTYDAATRKWDSAISKAPIYDGVTYRGMSDLSESDIKSLSTSEEITFSADSGSSAKAWKSSLFTIGDNKPARVDGVIMEIHNPNGRYLGNYRGEFEVVHRLGTSFRVTKRQIIKTGGKKNFQGDPDRILHLVLEAK